MALKVLPHEHRLQACEGSEFSGLSPDSLDREGPMNRGLGVVAGALANLWLMVFALESG